MPKSVVITKEMIDEAVFSMVRESGIAVLTARNIAEKLCCSTQPIYKTYESMEELKKSASERLLEFMMGCIMEYKKTGCAFLDSGLGYIHFAKTEKVLFQMFCLDKNYHNILKPDIGNEAVRALMYRELEETNLSKSAKDKIFLQTMIFTYGLAVLVFLDHVDLGEDAIAQLLQESFDSYVGAELEELL